MAIKQFYWPPSTDTLRTTGVKYLPFVTATTYFHDVCGSSVVRGLYEGLSPEDETYAISIQKPTVIDRPTCGQPVIENWDLFIVGSEAEWPVGGYSAALGESGRTSNVTNAVGFLGGVLTKIIPYEECRFESGGGPVPEYCRLRYNPETATLFGTATETLCGDGPIESDTVRVKEIDTDPARVRTFLTTRAGTYVIGALEPGIRHVLWVRPSNIPTDSMWDPDERWWKYTHWRDAYTGRTDTLTFLPGERMEYDIDHRRLTPCSEPPPRPG